MPISMKRDAEDAEIIQGSPGMSRKNDLSISENDRKLIKEHAHTMREALFACTTETQVECAVAFARFLNFSGINSENYRLFLRFLTTNNPWVVGELLHDRDPRLLFTTIRPDEELIDIAFKILSSRHPDEMNILSLEAVLGIIQNAYFDPDDGFRIRPIRIMDINALGKFLLKDEAQAHPRNRFILEILDRLTMLGQYYGEPEKNILAKHAFSVRFAYFDHTRNMGDAIPSPLLVSLPNRSDVSPEKDFAGVVTERRKRKRDANGRFVK
ncbi:MAG: hypothetical protein A2Z99_03640 [Treponema sp. GWB1_62_6]|nr:MAG: hypothetical protein A2Y36_11515 [Treponema sp. GWA1_62_8]OHE66539.1 MAG: hypothetical protein A2Z99_03640 [Treponema sp. GWB1_62_6]OHE70083.1 MAG: hypothetical protein A2001_09205 [Treponema sp. GWC1_61_84]OHE71117.1 MAG: hypothetical protein A2413_11780 [Treponema sp. RIFOXYC1_FULL_61_9]HCM25357.1 hypothetical protein [Treponema sp.]